MEITVEISYYPLTGAFQKPVEDFITELKKDPEVKLDQGIMSCMLTGSYDNVMELLNQKMKLFMKDYPSVFTLKISNTCHECLYSK